VDSFDPATGKNIKWSVRLGDSTHSTPVIAAGKVLVGTNNDQPRDPRHQGDRGVLMCFDEATGKFLWQLVVSKYPPIRNWNGDNPHLGICSSPTVEGDRVYLVTNRCEVLCLTTKGLGEGNEGPFKDEADYVSVEARSKKQTRELRDIICSLWHGQGAKNGLIN
jgi:outer membrane protein assembly factor BamB